MLSYRYGTNLVSKVIKKGAVYPAVWKYAVIF